MKSQILLSLLLFFSLGTDFLSAQQFQHYTTENGAIIGLNSGRYNNRPLYINNSNAFVLAGDQPIARLAKGENLFGTFMLAIERNGKTKWLQQCSRIKSAYLPGRMYWEVSDKAFAGLKIKLDVVPMAASTGMTFRCMTEGILPGDQLIWCFGGAQYRKGQNQSWKLDVMGQPELLSWGFVPEESRNNQLEIIGNNFLVNFVDSASLNKRFAVAGNCTSSSATLGEASLWSNVADFRQSQPAQLPIAKGVILLEKNKSIYWAFEAFDQDVAPDMSRVERPEAAFYAGIQRLQAYRERLKIDTPDSALNAMAVASVAAIDGTWYPPVFVHGAMQWNSRFPGWRTLFGGTMYGWHDRIREEAKFYTDAQIKVSDKIAAIADSATLLTEQHPNSRFYGIGRINKDQKFYDMQTQFFDQLVEEYRWTADPELVKFFREALELHLVWMRDCFDPDGDGTYESYINTWPSDSQWYNGGGSAEETSYAYRGHLAARDMARNAGDTTAVTFHSRMLEKIKKGFFEQLWIKGKGHAGAYREQGGHGRLHEDPCLYSIFLPVDAGLTSPLQSVESLYYSEWALQNDKVPGGGRQVWTSNWVPAIWSVRELWPGDNYHLALSYFQAGLPDDGYDILRGTINRTGLNHLSPGNFGGVQGGIDFGDCVHPFTRALVTGLFGYHPDYPNGKVVIAPQFPAVWNHASIELPDVKIAFQKEANQLNYTFELARSSNLELNLPVRCEKIKAVTVNGKPVTWKLLPAVGSSSLQLILPSSGKVEVSVVTDKPLAYIAPYSVEANCRSAIQLSTKDAMIVGVEDPQGILESSKIVGGVLTAKLSANKGFHTVVLKVLAGDAPQYRVFRIKMTDPAGELRESKRFVQTIPSSATWSTIDIKNQWNADVRMIYRQKYLSPRPNTVSVRLGTDGYSPWTFPHWKSLPPEIKLDRITGLLDNQDCLVTPQKVPFAWSGAAKNIAFTSLWDNFPKKIEFPVHQSGDAIFFLVSGSTNVMQCRISNAVILLNYADGKTDSLELVPPVNYWNLSTIDSHATAPGQGSRIDYDSEIDQFCMPVKMPETVQLGENCRAMLLNLKMRKGIALKSITLETRSQEVVVGLMGITVMRSNKEL